MTDKAVTIKATRALLEKLQNSKSETLKKSEMVIIKAQADALMVILKQQSQELRLLKAKTSLNSLSLKCDVLANVEGFNAEEEEDDLVIVLDQETEFKSMNSNNNNNNNNKSSDAKNSLPVTSDDFSNNQGDSAEEPEKPAPAKKINLVRKLFCVSSK